MKTHSFPFDLKFPVLTVILRVMVGLCAVGYSIYYIKMWYLAINGNTGLVFSTLTEIDSNSALSNTQIIGGMIGSGFTIMAISMIFISINRLFAKTEHSVFGKQTTDAIRLLGYGLVVYWLAIVIEEFVLPWLFTLNFPLNEKIDLEYIPFDAEIIILAVGVVMLFLSRALEKAREIEAENQQFI